MNQVSVKCALVSRHVLSTKGVVAQTQSGGGKVRLGMHLKVGYPGIIKSATLSNFRLIPFTVRYACRLDGWNDSMLIGSSLLTVHLDIWSC